MAGAHVRACHQIVDVCFNQGTDLQFWSYWRAEEMRERDETDLRKLVIE